MAIKKDLFEEPEVEINRSDDRCKAFTVEGLKRFQYISHDLIQVTDAGTKITYTISWLFLKGVLQSLAFTDRQADVALKTMLNYLDVVLDFNNHKVFIPAPRKRPDMVLQALSRAVKEYDPETQTVFGDNPEEDVKEWHQVL